MSNEEDEAIEGEVIVVDNETAMTISRVEIDTQIATAKKYPRSIKEFKRQALEMATLDEETAATMFYTLPRAGKPIQGPSIRMAEVVGASYGNLRYGARIVSTDEKFITAQGACHDLEKNIAITYEVRRRITNRKGERFNDDMIQTTGNAALSIALREAIFRVVPRSLFNSIYEQARLTSVGKAKTMSEQRHGAFEWFKKAGATEQQLLAFLGRAGIDDITLDDIIALRGLVTAIKEGEITIDDALRPQRTEPAGKPASSPDELASKAKTATDKPATTEKTKQTESTAATSTVKQETKTTVTPPTQSTESTKPVEQPVSKSPVQQQGVTLQDIVKVEMKSCKTQDEVNACYMQHRDNPKIDGDWLQQITLARGAELESASFPNDRMSLLREKIANYKQAARLHTLLNETRADKSFSSTEIEEVEKIIKDRLAALTGTLPGMQ